MSFSDLLASWTEGLVSIANLALIFAALMGVILVVVSLNRAHAETKEGRSPVRHYFAAGIAGAITMLGVVVGALSLLVTG